LTIRGSGTLGPQKIRGRGDLGPPNWSQVYGNYYKKSYQFFIYFR